MARRRSHIFAPSEGLIQAAVIDHWKLLGVPGSLVAAIPNANAHGQPGLTKGLPDLLVISPRLGRLTGFIELKAENGVPSDDQLAIRRIVKDRGIPYAMTWGRDEPIRVLEDWGAVRRTTRAAEVTRRNREWRETLTPEQLAALSLAKAAGGHARAASLTPERRTEIAALAARTRWAP